MFGLRASCCPLATTGSLGRKVPSVALRLKAARPNWKSIAGEQVPKEVELAVAATCVVAVEAKTDVLVAVLLETAAATGTQEADALAARSSARRMLGVCILVVWLL